MYSFGFSDEINSKRKTFCHRQVGENSLFFPEITSEIHLCFTVTVQFNNLSVERGRYSEVQENTYRIIKSYREDGLGYRRISNLLNEGITTGSGKKWSSAYVYSVITRYSWRQERLRVRNLKFPFIYSRMWVEKCFFNKERLLF